MIPDGFLLNAAGHLVPEDQVREHDKLRDSTVRTLADIAEKLNVALGQFKEKALADVADLVAIAAEKYDVKMGGEKGNVSLTTFDGEYKLVRSTAERYQFTEEIEAAKALIDDCILRWSEGANANIRALVDRAFRTDSRGQLKTSAVLELLRLDIDDEGWKRAMTALRDSIHTAGTATYIRLYKRKGKSAQYRQVPLDLAAV
ncbi:DUF3164 family protein [Microbulbifer sp. OS29]|uniref:DUF3164 family protein n=1 Tax=Microbulbifer okhotskensis TaxID=2926617 RepID=A0A9X2ERV8_9GAMM|nr:DUF3164 family protein [Microbulbifer okhotskensis]MCO1336245.1 DUF3164 family protein [Microbulbifer okhotskensis]